MDARVVLRCQCGYESPARLVAVGDGRVEVAGTPPERCPGCDSVGRLARFVIDHELVAALRPSEVNRA